MKQIIVYTLFLLLSLSSCTDYGEEPAVSHGEEVYINISARPLDPSMTQVRIIVTDVSSGQVLINNYPAQPEPSGDYKLSVYTGRLNFYVILNEPPELTFQLSNIQHNSALSALVLDRGFLPATESVNSTTQTNLPAMGRTEALVRVSSGTAKYGEASMDGGSTWTNTLPISLERLAAKITLALRKKTPNDLDKITIHTVAALRVPQYGYILPKVYDSPVSDSLLLSNTPVQFTNNTETYTQVVYEYIVPEYISETPADKDKALCLKLKAGYNQKTVLYTIPVRGSMNIEDYSLKRNTHYILKATLATEGEMLYLPEIKYQVADWTDAVIDSEFLEESAITFSRRWEAGTHLNGTTINVENNEYAEFYFTLSHPKGASWAATLTNTIDFMFEETDGAVSAGVAREGHEYKIRIKPRRDTQQNGIKTEFYITVNNGTGNVELNLPGESVGTKSRYTLVQIPN